MNNNIVYMKQKKGIRIKKRENKEIRMSQESQRKKEKKSKKKMIGNFFILFHFFFVFVFLYIRKIQIRVTLCFVVLCSRFFFVFIFPIHSFFLQYVLNKQ